MHAGTIDSANWEDWAALMAGHPVCPSGPEAIQEIGRALLTGTVRGVFAEDPDGSRAAAVFAHGAEGNMHVKLAAYHLAPDCANPRGLLLELASAILVELRVCEAQCNAVTVRTPKRLADPALDAAMRLPARWPVALLAEAARRAAMPTAIKLHENCQSVTWSYLAP